MTLAIEQQKKIDLALMILCPLGLIVVFILARLGYGLAVYSDTYVAATQVVMAALTVILPAIRYTRRLVFPYWFIFIINGNIYLYCIPLFLGYYDTIWWWDEFAHWMSTILVTLIVFIALCLIQYLAKRVYMPAGVMCFLTLVGGFALGNIWEIMEGTIDWLFGGDYMQHWIADTLEDIHMDFVGSMTMTIIAYFVLRRTSIEELVSEIDERNLLYNMVHKNDNKH